LTAGTGDPIYDVEESVASDRGLESTQGTTSEPTVGRTAYDLIYEQGISAALGKLILALDPVEVLATLVYILFGLWVKGNGLVMRFWVFCALLGGYHLVFKPAGGAFARLMERKVRATPKRREE
jgi:hypothetical protein